MLIYFSNNICIKIYLRLVLESRPEIRRCLPHSFQSYSIVIGAWSENFCAL